MKERWKRAFELDPESTTETRRVEISPKRKAWISRAWIHSFGFLPNAIPVYNERKGFFHTPGFKIQYHHVIPIGESTRLYGEGDEMYNDPRNIVPICEVNHVGKGAWIDDFIIHQDVHELWKIYREVKAAGGNPFKELSLERRRMTDAGLIYHNAEYDEYLLDLADRVVSSYQRDHPEDRY